MIDDNNLPLLWIFWCDKVTTSVSVLFALWYFMIRSIWTGSLHGSVSLIIPGPLQYILSNDILCSFYLYVYFVLSCLLQFCNIFDLHPHNQHLPKHFTLRASFFKFYDHSSLMICLFYISNAAVFAANTKKVLWLSISSWTKKERKEDIS